MSSKTVLPPSRLKRSSPEATVNLLQKKLDVAERETVNLVGQLAGFGFSAASGHAQLQGTMLGPGLGPGAGEGESKRGARMSSPEPVQPFLPRSVETEVLHKNYQALVSRLCRNESQIQTLRLNLCTLQAAKNLTKQETGTLKEQVAQLSETHTAEVRKLNQELEKGRREWKEATEARMAAEEEVSRLRAALKDTAVTKTDIAVGYEDIQIAKHKLSKRVNELREELAREASLRSSLEESHSTLLERVHEMETMVDMERREVQSMNENCIELRHEGARLLEEKKQETARRKALEQAIISLRTEQGSKDEKMAELLEQNKTFASALAASKQAISDLHSEVEKQAKLVIDTQTLLVQVQCERETLQETVQKTSPQHIKEENQNAIREFEAKMSLLEKQKLDLESRLSQEREGKQNVQNSSSKLEEQLISSKLKLSELQTKYQTEIASLEHAVDLLKNELEQANREREAILKSKETLIDEVNQAVDGMTEERQSVHEKINQAQSENASLRRQKDIVEQDNTQLRERITILEQQQVTHQKVESSISELLDSKNRLAYEKGQLQNRVEQLQRDLHSMENALADANKQKAISADLEEKSREVKRELRETKQALQHMENVYKQEQVAGGRRDEDFSLAIQARDGALKEADRLKAELEALKLREKQKTSSLQRSLSDARSDHAKMAATLETIMGSHGQLQVAVETLQTDVGQKDHELAALRQERKSQKRSMEKMQRDLSCLQEQLVAMENADANQLSNLNAKLAQAAQSQTKMAARLQESLTTITKQQVTMEDLQSELDKKAAQYQILSDTRQHEREELTELRSDLEAQVNSLKQQVKSARDGSHKKLSQELGELRQANTEARSRAEKLDRENKELQTKLDDTDQKMSKLKIRMGSQKAQLDQLRTAQKANRDLETRLEEIQGQLREMEQTKAEYGSRNKEQARTIASFMDQMGVLQRELEGLAELQKQDSDQSKDTSSKLEKEAGRSSRLEKENAKLKKRLAEMDEKRRAAEEKLVEASNESLEISNHLQEAHEWFKKRYGGLQKSLSETRKQQARLEKMVAGQQRELSQEKQRSHDQTKKAQEMIRASRQALSQLANQAEVDQLETKTHMNYLARRVQAERDHATLTDHKMQKLLNSSAGLVEELALELDRSYGNAHH